MLKNTKNDPLDQVILVDEHDEEVRTMDKVEAHRHPAKLHRASSVLLKNTRGEWLVQQRSEQKIVGALQWANSCCGNLRPGENYEECAHRRLKEELGISGVNLEELNKFTYQVKCNEEFGEHEMDTVFIGEYDGKVHPNPAEVKDYKWLTTQELLDDLSENSEKYAPWTKLVLNQHPDFKKE